MNYERIGEFISKKRKEKNLTQKELANLIGVTDKAVSKWERGLGCPDVSILEILSKELGVSILEILKGRMIENEIIKVTELNDYVKDTIIYSKESNKNKLKNMFSNFVFLLTIIIVSFLTIMNINHIIYLNRNVQNSLNDVNIKDIKENEQEINRNIKIIDKNQGKFSDENYKKIKEHLNKSYNSINTKNLLKLYNKKIKMNDLYVIDCSINSNFSILEIYKILADYDESIKSYKDVYFSSYISKVFAPKKSVYDSYKYQLIDMFKDYYVDLDMMARVQNIIYYQQELKYLTENIIEVGELSE